MLLAFVCLLFVLHVNSQQYTTPVPILKQINRHNADGSYTYGYEGADKSFKIETKYPDGEVHGKYGYVDDQGQLREVEYGASRRGFEPQGSDINVAPPTLTSNNPYPLGPNEIDDGQYREDPRVYYNSNNNNRNTAPITFPQNNYQQPRPARPQWTPPPQQQPQPLPPRNYPTSRFSLNELQQSSRPQWTPPPANPQYYNPPAPPQPQYQPQPQYYNPPPPPSYPQQPYPNVPNHHHPALRNIDIASGSYSIDYTGRK